MNIIPPDNEVILDSDYKIIYNLNTQKLIYRLNHDDIRNVGDILKAEINNRPVKCVTNPNTSEKILYIQTQDKDLEFLKIKNNKIISLHLYTTTHLPDYFLLWDKDLTEIFADNLQTMGNSCFYECPNLHTINMPNLIKMGDECFAKITDKLTSVSFPNLITMGKNCFLQNKSLQLIAPKLNQNPPIDYSILNNGFCNS